MLGRARGSGCASSIRASSSSAASPGSRSSSSSSSRGSISRDFSSSSAAISTRNSVADLEVELAARLEVVEVGEHDVGELDLQQVDLLAQDERQQQVERPGEDLEVELERGDGHGATR